MTTMSLVPAAILWLGRQLLEDGPLSAMRRNIDDLGRVMVAGVLISLYIGAVSLMISSFTGRKSIAVAVIIILVAISTTLAFALAEAIDHSFARYLVFLSPVSTVEGMALTLFNQTENMERFADSGPLPFWNYAAAMISTIVIAIGVMLWRYLPDE
jgi:hypothetical protein